MCRELLLIGDTAAFIEVEVQGALLTGHHAAVAVIKELNGDDGCGEYTEWWQKSFKFNGEGYMEVSRGYGLVPIYIDDELDYLFSLLEGECLQGTYSQYKTPKLMWGGFLKHTDTISIRRGSSWKRTVFAMTSYSVASSPDWDSISVLTAMSSLSVPTEGARGIRQFQYHL